MSEDAKVSPESSSLAEQGFGAVAVAVNENVFVGKNGAGRVAEFYGDARTAGFLIKPASVRVFELTFHVGDKLTAIGR